MNILLINTFIYVIAFIYFFRKKGVTIYTVLWFEFAIIAFLGYYTFEVGIYEYQFGPHRLSELTLLPYIFVFLGHLIAFEPFRKLNPNLDTPIPYRKYTSVLLNLWIIAMTVYLILKISESIVTAAYGMGDYYNERSSEGVNLFDYSDNLWLKGINKIGDILSTPIIPFVVAYCVQCWKRREHTVKSLILITLCFLPYVFGAAAGGSRTNLFFVLLNIMFFFLLYSKAISAKVRRIAVIISVGFVAIMFSYAMTITEERFGEKYENNIDPILRYFGEPFPNVGFQYYGKVKEHSWGLRRFGGIIDDREFRTSNEKRDYWTKKTGVSAYYFSTYWIDMYIEFSEIGAFIFVILYALIIKKLTGPKLTVYNMSFLFLYFRQMASGFRSLDWFGIGFVYTVVAMFIINFAIKKLYFSGNSSSVPKEQSIQRRQGTYSL